MAVNITNGPLSVLPSIGLSDYTADQSDGPLTHRVLSRQAPEITLRPLGAREGSFTLDFASEAEAATARRTLATPTVWTLVYPERTSVEMEFIVAGLGYPLDGSGRWCLTVQFEEVS